MAQTDRIPEGYYNAVAFRQSGEDGAKLARWGRSGKNKTKQVLMYFRITDGPFEGRTVPWFGYFSKASFERTMEALRYCGWKGDNVLEIEKQPMDQVVQIVVEHNEYDGKTHERVAWVNRPGGGTIKLADPMSTQDLDEFAAQLSSYAHNVAEVDGARVSANSPGNGEKSRTHTSSSSSSSKSGDSAPFAQNDEPPPLQDDDIPF